uniref:Uncharacterized protein n=1 Tax=Auxenochlorella protothecoides TaxID=3075 RepID=A0A1D1ZT16_AUXPR
MITCQCRFDGMQLATDAPVGVRLAMLPTSDLPMAASDVLVCTALVLSPTYSFSCTLMAGNPVPSLLQVGCSPASSSTWVPDCGVNMAAARQACSTHPIPIPAP